MHNCELFFNSGNLDGDEFLREAMHVTTCLELVGVKIFAYVADAGGANKWMYNLLQKGKQIVWGPWSDEECASFVNFLDRSRRIACVTGATHDMKVCHNNIFKSKPNGKRCFFPKDKVHFCWQQFVACYERDSQKQIRDGTTGDSGLTTQAIHLDKWSVMNVALAKAPFMDTAICELFLYMGGKLGCLDTMYKTKLEDASQR